jgi:hypothetical protein
MANEMTANVNRSLKVGALTIGGTVQNVLHDGVVNFSKTIPAGTNAEIDISVDVSTVLAMAIEGDNDCDIYTNAVSSGSYDDHLVLKAKQPLIWATGDPASLQFFTTDVTKLYVTCAAPTLLKFGAALDSTPVLTP